MDTFTRGYLECALWSSTDDSGEPIDQSGAELADETIARMERDCTRFQEQHADLLAQTDRGADYDGHDFWLTRNGHGAGFWDGDLPEALGESLTNAAKYCGECNLYIGDDGLIYILESEETNEHI